MDTTNLPVVKHPLVQFTLIDAVQIAVGCAKVFEHKMPETLEEVRENIRDMVSRSGHNWLTGAAALDVLDAAIKGVEIDTETCRFS